MLFSEPHCMHKGFDIDWALLECLQTIPLGVYPQ